MKKKTGLVILLIVCCIGTLLSIFSESDQNLMITLFVTTVIVGFFYIRELRDKGPIPISKREALDNYKQYLSEERKITLRSDATEVFYTVDSKGHRFVYAQTDRRQKKWYFIFTVDLYLDDNGDINIHQPFGTKTESIAHVMAYKEQRKEYITRPGSHVVNKIIETTSQPVTNNQQPSPEVNPNG